MSFPALFMLSRTLTALFLIDRAGIEVTIKNKFDRSVTMGVDASNSAAPMSPLPAHKWVLVNLATPGTYLQRLNLVIR